MTTSHSNANHQDVGGAGEGGIERSPLEAVSELGEKWLGSAEQLAVLQEFCGRYGLKRSSRRVRCWRHVVNQRHRCSWRCRFPAEAMFDHWSLFVRPNGEHVLLLEPYLGRHDEDLGHHAALDERISAEIDAWCNEHRVGWCQLPMLSPYLPGRTVPILLFGDDGWDPLAEVTGEPCIERKAAK